MPAVQDEAAAGQATEALVYSVDVKTNQQAVQLRFKGWASDDQAEALAWVGMNAMVLRQWLGFVYAQYRLANWPTTAWSQWMEEASQPASALTQTQSVLWH